MSMARDVTPSAGSGATWTALSAALNCTASSAATTLRCLRAVPAPRLRSAVTEGNLMFGPATDNGTIFSDQPARLESGNFVRVSVLVGTNDEELGNTTMSAAATLLAFTCPAAKTAKAHTRFGPTWQYRFMGDFPTGTSRFESPRAFHGSEIRLIFGRYDRKVATDQQRAASVYMQGRGLLSG